MTALFACLFNCGSAHLGLAAVLPAGPGTPITEQLPKNCSKCWNFEIFFIPLLLL